MAHIFVSHRDVPADVELARELRRRLTEAGHSVFLDVDGLQIGDEWPTRIHDELGRAEVLLLLLSGAAAGSDMVIEEVRIARELKRRTGQPRILPVMVGEVSRSELPYDLSAYVNRLQSGQWSTTADTSALLAKVHDALSAQPARDKIGDLQGFPDRAHSELPGGQEAVQPPGATYSTRWYVPRPVEERAARSYLAAHGSPVVLIGPQAIGKTWLLKHLLVSERADDDVVVEINVGVYDDEALATLDKLLQFVAFDVALKTGVDEAAIETEWRHPFRTPTQKLRRFMEDHVLPHCPGRLLLALDRVDAVGSHPYGSDFFRMLRSWEDNTGPPWDCLRLLLTISTDPSRLVTEVNSSPFNLCPPITVGDLDQMQVADLFQKHGVAPREPDIASVVSVVGGHPYLVRLALFLSRQGGDDLGKVMANAAAEDGPFADHLRSRLLILRAHDALAGAVKAIICDGAASLEFLIADRLRCAGMLTGRRGNYRLRYPMYRQFFQMAL